MAKISFSRDNVNITEYALHHDDMERALRLYFSAPASLAGSRFIAFTASELADQLNARLAELDLASALTVLSAIEAAFRIDYLQRCYLRKKDQLSRDFRALHKRKKVRASLEDEILDIWEKNSAGATRIIADLKRAFKFRHWLAHGRYWTPKHGQKYDYTTVFGLAVAVLTQFPLSGP